MTGHHVENLIEEYGLIFDKVRDDVFEELRLSRELSEKLTEIGASLFAKSPNIFTYAGNSGVLVAGFGEEDLFPSFKFFFVEGIAGNVLKYREYVHNKITLEVNASITPFAQSEMVWTFIEGVNLDYHKEIQRSLNELVNKYPDIIIGSIEKLSIKDNEKYKKILKESSAEISN
ncbi:MAG: hypothetical protein WBA22_02595 [Candidatus Methanofastidiosia archaeon]